MALIYRVGWSGVADITVFDAGSQGLADLLVWRTEDQDWHGATMALGALWMRAVSRARVFGL